MTCRASSWAIRVRRPLAWVALWVLAAIPGPALADADYAVEPEPGVSLRALLDLRVVRGGEAPSWMEGGPGKTRYGGIDDNGRFERVTRFAIAQFALEPSGMLPGDVLLHAQVNWEGDVDVRGQTSPDHDVPRLIEGWLRREWAEGGQGWALQVGVSNPPFSLEHTGPAWTPRFTLTPSALDSWLWEEGRLLGLQGEWWRPVAAEGELSVFAGLGWGPDQQGVLLAQRGWILSDYLSGINSVLPLPAPAYGTAVFDERDGRPALYAGVNVRDPWHVGALRLGYYDNLGDLAVDGVWETRYGIAGVALQPLPGLDILFQYLIGKTAKRSPAFDSTVQALYPLVSYRWRGFRVTARYDDFRVDDNSASGPPTRERGHAWTFAALFEFWLRHRVGFEYILVDSERAASPPDPSDDGWQLSYRFRY
jgi:hypothetical protein